MSVLSSSRRDGRPAVPGPSAAAMRDPATLVTAALTVLTLLLRLSQIHQSLFGDEVFTYTDILGRSAAGVIRNVHTGAENSPPLFFLFAWATAKLGNATMLIRLPSIVLGAATVPVISAIGRETVGRWTGVLAGAIVLVSPFSFYYGVEARPYASMAFFVAVSTWALLRAVRSGGRGWWALYTVAAAAAAYCHYTCIFVLAVQGLWSLWACRERIAAPLLSAVVAAALYVPWIGHLRGKALGVIAILEPLTAGHVLTDLMRPIAGYPYAPLSAIPTWPGLIALVVVSLGGLAALAWRSWAAPGAWPEGFWLLVALGLATPVGLLLYSEAATDLWLARGLYASMPAAALVLATLLVAIPRPVGVAAIGLALAVLVVGAVRAASPSWRRPPTRAVAAFVDRVATPGDPVAASDQFVGQPLYNQVRRRHRFVAPSVAFRDTPAGGRAVFVVSDVDRVAPAAIPAVPRGFTLIKRRRYLSAILPISVSVYQRR